MYQIFESNDYEKLTYLFFDNGLEIEPGIGRPGNVVKCWECIDSSSKALIGGAALETRSGELVVADMAVNPNYRKTQIGTRLLRTVEEEIIKLGGKEAWLVAKVPLFYLKLGWEIVDKEQAPDITKCFSCPKYGKECTPKVMRKTFYAERGGSQMRKVNIKEKLSTFSEYWSPRIVGDINESYVKLAKLKGEFLWHMHENEDEMFMVVKGRLVIKLHSEDIVLEEGEFLIIPKGIEHMPVAEEEVHVMLLEPKSTLNTGNVKNDRTVEVLKKI